MKCVLKILDLIIIICTISTNTISGLGHMVKYQQRNDLSELKMKIIFGTYDGRILVHENSSKADFHYAALKLNTSVEIIALAEANDRLIVAKQGDGIHVFPFNVNNPQEYECKNDKKHKSRELKIDAPKVSGMVVVDYSLYFVSTDGSTGYCVFCDSKCFQRPMSDEEFTGIAHDWFSGAFFVSMRSGILYRCSAVVEETADLHCKKVFKYTHRWSYNGLSAVYVAFGAVWLGTESGRLLKCPLTEKENELECDEFFEIEWKLFSYPIIYSITSKYV